MEIWSCRECVREHGYLWRIDSPFSVYSVCQHLAVRTFQKFMTSLLELCTHGYTRLCTRHTNQSAVLAPRAHGEGCVSLNWKISSFFFTNTWFSHLHRTRLKHWKRVMRFSCEGHATFHKQPFSLLSAEKICGCNTTEISLPNFLSFCKTCPLWAQQWYIFFCFKARGIFPKNVKNRRNESRKAILGGLLTYQSCANMSKS